MRAPVSSAVIAGVLFLLTPPISLRSLPSGRHSDDSAAPYANQPTLACRGNADGGREELKLLAASLCADKRLMLVDDARTRGRVQYTRRAFEWTFRRRRRHAALPRRKAGSRRPTWACRCRWMGSGARLKSTRIPEDQYHAFSGRSLQHEQVSALRAGCDLHLTKPGPPVAFLARYKTTRPDAPAAPSRPDL